MGVELSIALLYSITTLDDNDTMDVEMHVMQLIAYNIISAVGKRNRRR